MTSTLRHSPRHFPDLAAEFGPRGWSVFRTADMCGASLANAVFFAAIPVECARRHGFTELVIGDPAALRQELVELTDNFDAHVRMCRECATARQVAVRRALRGDPREEG